MLINSDKMLPITKLQKAITQKVREVAETGEPIFVLKNNELTAVIVSKDEYESLKQAKDILEHLELAEMLEERLKHYDASKSISWEQVKAEHGL
ncbi:MAG: type II toxin-antitoxin system Phd/YefM family antitoxin [Thermodesulfovibrionales bacterium]|nr:type II toxin-antitoxin system Phd/YefM family antitoxin [Thermodesulfovibrionales bacterium]